MPKGYIDEGMGHSLGNDVTKGYQDMYPLEKRFEFNNKLLNLSVKEEVDVDSMSPEEMKAYIKKMMRK